MRMFDVFTEQARRLAAGSRMASGNGRNNAEPISTEQRAECPDCPKCGCNQVVLLTMPETVTDNRGLNPWPVPGKALCLGCDVTFRVQFADELG